MKKNFFFLSILLIAVFFCFRSFFLFRPYYFHIPVKFINQYRTPSTSIEIEGNVYQVEIDLGTKMPLSLHKSALDHIKKDPSGVSRRLDFRGNKYETPLYIVHSIQAGDFLLKKTKVREESLDFSNKKSIIYDSTTKGPNCQIAGRIGRDFFDGRNLFMDFHHSKLIICSNIKDIKTDNYKTDTMISVPFENTPDGIILRIGTDLGVKNFVLDTGTTASVLRSSSLGKDIAVNQRNGMTVFETSKFIINDIDFGSRDLYLLDISPSFDEIDGFLGMDFLNDYMIYLDFSKNTAFIDKSPDTFPAPTNRTQ